MAKGDTDFSRNNLDCLRLVFASIVVFFHIYALTTLSAFSFFGTYFSPHFAVKGFFVISGLLIYRSYMRSSTMRSYLEKRVRRIYPAYFTIIIVAALVLPPLGTAFPLHSYGIAFWKYLGANLIFLNFLAPSLPGVFTGNDNPAVNGALWTLKIEVAFYLLVPVIHYLCKRIGTKKVIGALFVLSSIWKYGFEFLASRDGAPAIYGKLAVQLPAQLVYFIAGILLLLYFDQLKYHFRTISVITAGLFLLDHFIFLGVLDVLWISGVVFVFGFWHYLGNFSKYGDFSYGVYIVHWPIVQTLIMFGVASRIGLMAFFLLCVALVFVAAVMMWKLVESRFLASSSHYRQVSETAHASVPSLK